MTASPANRHPIGDEYLLDYATGAAPEPIAVLVATHAALNPASRTAIRRLEATGGALLEDLAPAALDDGALDRALAALDSPPARTVVAPDTEAAAKHGALPWDELMALRDEQRKKQDGAVWLIKGKDLPLENSKMGNLRWYMHPHLKAPCINTLMIYVQEIEPEGRSARFHHPGNQVIYVMQGEGYTSLEGEKYHWAKGDVVQLPLRVRGTTVQNFNTSKDTVARFVCCEPNHMESVGVDRGCGFEMLENATSFKKA